MSGKVFLLATCLLAAGCASNNVTQTGVVTDATMNTVTILTGSNQTMSFSTLNADRSELKDLRLGDRLTSSPPSTAGIPYCVIGSRR